MISSGRIAVDPSAPLPLAGYAARHALASPSTDVLEANWMAWQEPNAGLSLILTLDTLFSSSSFEAALRDHLAGQGVALENLAVIASHTHFAPSIDPEKPNLGVCDPEYIDHVAKQVTRSVLGGLDTAKSITRVSAHRSVAPGSIYRRRRGVRVVKRWPLLERGAQMLPNAKRPIPRTVRIWRFEAAAGGAAFALVSWPCHPVSRSDSNAISADYIGPLRTMLRKHLGENCPVLFLPGVCGDIRPDFRGKRKLRDIYPYLWQKGFAGADARLEKAFDAGLCHAAETALTAEADMTWDATAAQCSIDTVRIDLADLLGAPQTETMTISAVSVCGLHVLAAGAELTSTWLAELGWTGDEPDRILTGYTGACFGYLPTDDQIACGGYEVSGFAGPFGLKGGYDPARPVGPIVLKAFEKVTDQSQITRDQQAARPGQAQ
ncbi:MAG: hypothetical protein CMN19_08415 [Roseovarius sp.]|nr:hypothetical protein [Roseovarius sp.]